MKSLILHCMMENLPGHDWQDAWVLLSFYKEQAVNDLVRCPSEECLEILGWGKRRYNAARASLMGMCLIEPVVIDMRHYTRIQ